MSLRELPAAFRWAAASSVMIFCAAHFLDPAFAQDTGGEKGGAPAVVSFTNDIAPIFVQKCLTCHGPEKKKGGFQLHTFEFLMKGGESKEATITPGQPQESKLFQLLVTKDPDDRMPQKDDPLPAAQVALIERWIKEGGKFDGPDPAASLLTFVAPATHPDPPTAYPLPVPVLGLAFSPEGKELAVGGYHEITIWSPPDGKLLRRIKNVAQRTQCLAYSPDGSLLAVAGGAPGKSGEVRLFDPVKAAPVKALLAAADMMLAAAFSPNGTRLAVGGADNAIRIFNVADGKQELLIEQHADWVMALAFSPDGSHIASASRDKSARTFDTKTGEMESSYLGHSDAVFGVAFSPDGKRIYTSGRDKKVHIWEAKDAKKVTEITGFEDEVFQVAAQGEFIFSCSADKKAWQHRMADKSELVRMYSGHADFVYALALHEATRRLATGSYDGEIRVWNTDDGQLVTAFKAAPGYLAAKQP